MSVEVGQIVEGTVSGITISVPLWSSVKGRLV